MLTTQSMTGRMALEHRIAMNRWATQGSPGWSPEYTMPDRIRDRTWLSHRSTPLLCKDAVAIFEDMLFPQLTVLLQILQAVRLS